MSSVGTGVGGNVGGPLIPLQRDIEATAWTEVNKAALGIVPDSIEKAFIEFSPRYTFGYLGGFGYRSAASRPLLDHFLESVRFTQPSTTQEADTAWRSAYDRLANQLPPDLLARFSRERNLPFEHRNLSFIALDNLLTTAAKVLTRADQLGQTSHLDALEETRTTLNILLPFAALKGAINNGNETLVEVKNFLMLQGANYRYFDGFQQLLPQLQRALTLLERVNSTLSDTVNGQLTPQAIRDAAKAAALLATIGSQLERISLGTDLQLLLPSIKTLETIASSLALQNTLTAPLFLAAAWSSLGIFTSDSPLGPLGEPFEILVNALSAGLIAGIMSPSNKAGNELLSLMVTLSLTTFISLTALAIDSGLGLYPPRSDQDLQGARFFAFEAAIQLLVSSGILETFYREIIAVSGGDTEAQRLGASTLANATYLLLILSGALAAAQSPNRLIENEERHLQQGILATEEMERRVENEQTAHASQAIKLLTIALESRDYDAFLDVFHGVLENLGIAPDTLNIDMKALHNIGRTLAGLSDTRDIDPNLTNIINVM